MAKNDHHKMGISTIPQGDRGRCKNTTVSWGKLRKKLIDPQIDKTMTHTHYLTLSVDGKNKAKDVGSYVLGQFDNNIRKKENIHFRSGVALDIDHPTSEHINWLENELSDVCGYEFLAMTTRSHTIMQQKWRVIFPTLKPIPAEHYAAVSRILSSRLFASVEESMEAVDDVSHRVAQIMYFSSISKDGRFDTFHNEGELLDHEALLASFPGWEDWTKLPYAESRGNSRPGGSVPAEAPTEKTGLVGAFCRAYTIEEAMDRFLPGVYVKPRRASNGTVRWTYSKGSGSNGAIVYPDGHLYSNHGTDPCAERNVNAFDLVRLHLFGALDKADDGLGDKAMSKQPSFKAMREKLATDKPTQRQARKLQDEQVDAQFDALDAPSEAGDAFDDLSPTSDEDEPEAAPHVNGHAYLNNLDDEALELLGEAPRGKVLSEKEDLLGESPDDEEEGDEEVPAFVKSINDRHAFVMIGGKSAIIYEQGEGKIDVGPVDALHQKFENRQVTAEKGPEAASRVWMRHPKRRQFLGGITFDPLYKGKAKFNMWTGFNLKPNPKASCELILWHIRHIICSGNHNHSEYLINYLAHLVQRPEDKPGVALVFRGNKGAGKDTLGKYVGKMMREYYATFSNQEHFAGNHNQQLERSIFVHLEEAMWVGDRKGEQILKHLITGEDQFINPKFINGYFVKSYFRVLMSSNAEWVVPASSDERRYFVQNVSDAKRQNAHYFDALRAEMNGTGPAGLMAFLLARDIRSFNVRDVPQTEALQQQKRHGLTNLDLMWSEILEEGVPPGGELFEHGEDDGKSWDRDSITVPVNQFYAEYRAWVSKRRRDAWEPLEKQGFGSRLAKLCPSILKKNKRLPKYKGFQKVYVFPKISICRSEFDAVTNTSNDWVEKLETISDEIEGVSDGFDLLD